MRQVPARMLPKRACKMKAFTEGGSVLTRATERRAQQDTIGALPTFRAIRREGRPKPIAEASREKVSWEAQPTETFSR